ncbi:MAG TPA: CRISPR-associated ring nuclease Csm6 [Pyrinomonadaceae bacterium]|nr:CRISPR-associated ring nuclease Csm6 [Pyrinomonadaceae bacterium]HLE62647.1 CRISPR-associated ring nuclease Csm6 [Pyrinomonadaceae bacterium]
MNTKSKRNLLLCVAGGTPAIITETLWALSQKHGVRIDEIRVITTKEGRDKILTGKIGDRGAADESLLDPNHGQFYKFQKDYPANGSIRFDANSLYILNAKQTGVPSPRDDDGERLSDILTDDDNEKAANQICEIVRELAANENICIHATIAGGRKTMGLFLMAAMQLFGRSSDHISHVLVSKDVEFAAPKFFYKTPVPEPILNAAGKPKTKPDGTDLTTEDVAIYLATIPVVWLRGIGAKLLDNPVASYAQLVSEAQNELKFLEGRE